MVAFERRVKRYASRAKGETANPKLTKKASKPI